MNCIQNILHSYPIFGNRYDDISIKIINYMYSDDFVLGNYNKIINPIGIPLNVVLLRTNSKQDESFDKKKILTN